VVAQMEAQRGRVVSKPANDVALPDSLHAISAKYGIGCYHGQFLLQRLSDQEAIEGIAVVPGQVLDPPDMRQTDIEQSEAVGRAMLGHVPAHG
jgi:hypothetical protein